MNNLSNQLEMENKSVALMQPTFMPWMGYFGLILDADEFVFLDDFQFVRRSFHQRNRLFVNKSEVGFISVPVEHSGSQNTPLNATKFNSDNKWKRKFLGVLKHNYRTSENFNLYYGFIEDWLNRGFTNLSDFNIYFILFVISELKIETKILFSSDFNVAGQRSDKIMNLLEKTKASRYLSAKGSYGYMEEDNIFKNKNIEFLFQDFQPKPYPQKQTTEFVSYLSVLDSLLQQGSEETLKTIQKSSNVFVNAQAMKEDSNA